MTCFPLLSPELLSPPPTHVHAHPSAQDSNFRDPEPQSPMAFTTAFVVTKWLEPSAFQLPGPHESIMSHRYHRGARQSFTR